ncbi:uncharacterized protein FOMMEDRAFT_95808 [Fomitiporia mediterranea MF3/22]|uniref:uncharacterized protein n=1 Tax=Fomitiporia mediterranea (strain MF3/22) TaxID=694068 RepID=UPI0004408E40|nr:uncharacterized protein FOMMEDRAFT_95808 [Fomitiporia mediterranea MF3/22]EJC98575.1 hypothetical protein FOMMEDRAFT_95808 [Fomitiporia mediterranea MF3/22]
MNRNAEEGTPETPPSHGLAHSRKRRRSSSPLDGRGGNKRNLERLPPGVLLLALPGLLAVPPNHKSQVISYGLSLAALRKCVALGGLSPDIECRAWTGIAELGLRIVHAGWTQSEHFPWARGLDLEVENAIGKGLLIAQQNPSLVVYKQTLALTHARLAHWQHNEKYSRTLLKRLVSTFSVPKNFEFACTPPSLVYSTHLTGISQALTRTPPDLKAAFSTIQDLLSASEAHGDPPVTLLTHILRLRTLVDAGMWDAVGDSLAFAESALGLSYNDSSSPPTEKGKERAKEEFMNFEDPFEAAMAIHTLLMGVVYYTHLGKAKASSPRLSHLHALLDSDALSLFPNGTIDISLSSGPPLTIKCTHPRVLYHLAYLVSSVSKRDAVGRRPKRKLFANGGLDVWEKEIKKEIPLNPWAEPRDAEEVDERMVKMKADLLSELVAVCIMRSEFEDASHHLDELITHTRTFFLFTTYAARITLHHAHLAHALKDTDRALQCYAVAANLAAEGTFVNVSARAGGLALRIANGEGARTDLIWEAEVRSVVDACRGMGGTLEAIGHVLAACLSPEILAAKTHLKYALDIASESQDNHLRALVLALVSALYLRTAEQHSKAMLETCGQLAAGLGAAQKGGQPNDGAQAGSSREGRTPSSTTSVGNAALGLWVGQRFLEIYRQEGDEAKVRRQEALNSRLEAAVEQLDVRRKVLIGEATLP